MTETHRLKTLPQFFDAVQRGDKRFDVRRNDRQFQRGDIVILQYFHPKDGYARGPDMKMKEMRFRVGWTLHGPAFGVEAGYCVFSLEPIESSECKA